MCTPKDEGGLGLRDSKIWNKAMLFKILWDIHSNKNNKWIRWIHTFYLKGKDVWTWTHSKADHPIFKHIHKLRNVLIEATSSVNQAKQLLSTWFKND